MANEKKTIVTDRERNHLIDSMERAIPYAEKGMITVSVEATREIIALLKEQEAEKQKTGHWIFESEYCKAFWTHTCSECGSRMTTAYNTYAKRCWNCGAKMEGR